MRPERITPTNSPVPNQSKDPVSEFENPGEREDIAQRYRVANPGSLEKRGGEWYVGNLTVREWFETNYDGEPTNDAWFKKGRS